MVSLYIIFLILCFLALIGSLICDSDYGAVISFILCIVCIDKINERLTPTLNDVNENKAHIDTVYTIVNRDTTITYEINWNEGFPKEK